MRLNSVKALKNPKSRFLGLHYRSRTGVSSVLKDEGHETAETAVSLTFGDILGFLNRDLGRKACVYIVLG